MHARLRHLVLTHLDFHNNLCLVCRHRRGPEVNSAIVTIFILAAYCPKRFSCLKTIKSLEFVYLSNMVVHCLGSAVQDPNLQSGG